MKTKIFLIMIASSLLIISCKKEEETIPVSPPASQPHYYTSVKDFYKMNGSPEQSYTINSSIGGSFTSPQGTVVSIPANAFMNEYGDPITGNVAIQFKDIYKKSDMLFSNMPTQTVSGPLKSAGEFFIKAIQNNKALLLNSGKKITIEQPSGGNMIDAAMTPFVLDIDSVGLTPTWWPTTYDSLEITTTDYVFSLYQFNYPADSGTWCNSDNSSFFSTYTQTILTSHCNNADIVSKDVFLVFTGINTMVHVYANSATDNVYDYAPVGLQCTVVAIGVKDGKLYSSFTPITISANQTVNYTLAETTAETFKTQLKALN